MKIRCVERKNLNKLKYDKCIEESVNTRIYAFSDYLDVVTDHWAVLVLEDYEAVMPLPWRSKYGIKYIYPPCWTQQLGLFSVADFDVQLVDLFLKAIPKKFIKVTMQLNSWSASLATVQERVNYTLGLNNTYTEIFKGYRKDRKDRLKKFLKRDCVIQTETDPKPIINLFRTHYKASEKLNNLDYLKLEKLCEQKSLQPIILGVYNSDEELISGTIFFKDQKRIYYLFSANNAEGNKIQANTAMLDDVIKQHAETNLVLDFEGSMIPGIASFFKSFGSRLEPYYLFQNFSFRKI